MLANEISTSAIDSGYINVNNGTAIFKIISKPSVVNKNPMIENKCEYFIRKLRHVFLSKCGTSVDESIHVVRHARITNHSKYEVTERTKYA